MKTVELGYIFKELKSITVDGTEKALSLPGCICYLRNVSPMMIQMSLIKNPTHSGTAEVQWGDFRGTDDYMTIMPGETVGPIGLGTVYLHTQTTRQTGAKLLVIVQED